MTGRTGASSGVATDDAPTAAADADRTLGQEKSVAASGRARRRWEARDYAYGGLFGAAALLLPAIFHLLHLGSVFMPMYLPLVALAFVVRPATAACTALLVPLLLAALTGMPPFYPPVAIVMSLELAVMAGLIAAATARWPATNPWTILVPALLLGRVLNLGLTYATASTLGLPARVVTLASLLAGWPGLILILATVPPVVKAVRETGGLDARA